MSYSVDTNYLQILQKFAKLFPEEDDVIEENQSEKMTEDDIHYKVPFIEQEKNWMDVMIDEEEYDEEEYEGEKEYLFE
jgi:hypothetical protein